MKVLICCVNGISTSMLKEKINRISSKHLINSVCIGDIDLVLEKEQYDLILVAPQLAHRLPFFDRVSKSYHMKYAIIDHIVYGRMNAEMIYKIIDDFEKNYS